METGLKGRAVIADAGCSNLWDKVELELALIDQIEQLELAGIIIDSDFSLLKRKAGRIWFNGQRGVARWMGNTRIKRIGTYLIGDKQRQEMDKQLAPGDIS